MMLAIGIKTESRWWTGFVSFVFFRSTEEEWWPEPLYFQPGGQGDREVSRSSECYATAAAVNYLSLDFIVTLDFPYSYAAEDCLSSMKPVGTAAWLISNLAVELYQLYALNAKVNFFSRLKVLIRVANSLKNGLAKWANWFSNQLAHTEIN